MSGYVSVNRLSLIQLLSEERKQQAHMRKIAEMQRRKGLDNSEPTRFPHLHQGFNVQQKQKSNEIAKENDAKSKKLLDIMQSKAFLPPPPVTFVHPTSPSRRRPSLRLSQNNTDYLERVAKTKGTYDGRDWKKEFQEHQEHLKISRGNKLFTPRDIGVNRQRVKTYSTLNSTRTTPTASTMNLNQHFDKND